jgi:hypothetical protein
MTLAITPRAASGAAHIVPLEMLRITSAPTRQKLMTHPIYDAVDTVSRLREFMRYHVFAVWDFMCLAKRLQRDLTTVDVPWLPPTYPSLARFINSVVLGEESDVDPDGSATSHFDLYLSAMTEIGAPTDEMTRFVALLRGGVDVRRALAAVDVPDAVRDFVEHTLATALDGTTIEVLAAFVFGREDLIPEMFARLLPQWLQSRDAARFTYYVERHIELDGGEHGPAGERAIVELAGSDPSAWQAATASAQSAMTARIALWDGVYAAVTTV